MAWLGMDAGFDNATCGAPGVYDLLRGYGDGFGRRIVSNSTEFAVGAVLHEDGGIRVLAAEVLASACDTPQSVPFRRPFPAIVSDRRTADLLP